MPECPPSCPIVRAELRNLVKKAPWLGTQKFHKLELKAKTGPFKPNGDELILRPVDFRDHEKIDIDRRRDVGTEAIYPKTRETGTALEARRGEEEEYFRQRGFREEDGIIERESLVEIQYMEVENNGTQTDTLPLHKSVKPLTQKQKETQYEKQQDSKTPRYQDTRTPRQQEQQEQQGQQEQRLAGEISRDSEIHSLAMDRSDLAHLEAALGEECDPNCPRRISKRRRILEFEEKQRIADEYLLNEGFHYFENVCTCSLGCMIYALAKDPFVQSILASTALFTLGMKLSCELNAWFISPRVF